MKRRYWLALLPALALAACGKKRPQRAAALPAGARVLALGDSLTAGNGVSRAEQAWPAQLAQLTGWQVENAGISGDTSAATLQRLPALLARQKYDAILVGIGGNDMLRGVSAASLRENLVRIVRGAREHTTHVALIATPAPEPLRAAIGALQDAAVYAEVAQAENVLLIETVYARVLSDATLRSDQIHANAAGYAEIARQMAARLKAAGWV